MKRENKYLFSLILILMWFLFEFLAIRNTINIKLNVFYGTRYGSWMLLGPITFFYFKTIINANWRFTKKELLHFLPFIASVIIIPLFTMETINSRQVHYGMLSVFDHREKIISPLQYMYSVIFVLQFIHLGYYLFKNLSILKIYTLKLQSEYATIDRQVKWLRGFNITLLFVLLFSAIFLYVLLVTDIYRRYLDYIYVLPIGVLFYLISYYLMDIAWKPVETKNGKYAGSSLNSDDIVSYATQLDDLVRKEKSYMNPEIRLKDLAQMIKLSNHQVSQIINQHFQLSFFDYINRYRILEAKKIIEENPELTLLEVAFDAGFSNKTSFVNAFKKFEKTTPSKYREAIIYS
ncbi:helix-turn-helix domain-containing protein [Aquimarina sp. 2201CG5-10]|uniref:helix-turn-helix domain-containing protein n=1 Tax=Aquimarina callyspongiae TaxID=3098150 RepID=UPI002AB34633|nr:helix-turn-helix domain-containing protein [Aquimarina sp. 2201CG5-10]MDY8137101.1 helix-turn-helix domain-containing protein [Aquimarina sp. 2201CG5-10]